MRIALLAGLAGLAVIGCSSPGMDASAPDAGGGGGGGGVDASGGSGSAAPTPDAAPACPAAAGTLTIYALPPPSSLDWSTPNKLLNSVVASKLAATNLVNSGAAVMGHSIGHVNVALDCGDLSIPLTGQTDTGGGDWQALSDGAGLLLRDTPGILDAMPGGDGSDTIADIAAREQSGHVSEMKFTVNRAMCQRLHDFVDAYVAAGAYVNYDGASRARRMEGAGCAIFGAGVIDVGGLLRRSQFTPPWARTEMIGQARISDFLGSGTYRYGGNLVAVDGAGKHWLWPAGQAVPASALAPVVMGSSVLDAWNGPEDAAFGVTGATGAMATQLPFTIYDPEMMADWVDGVWAQALDAGTASALGATWTASLAGAAHVVTYDASCVAPQTIGFADDNDDLFVDSNVPN
jgi:hypothetical protein|nr:hypothetical protein [Kofleriaceae bacterium]